MIRRPIQRTTAILLGVASVALMLAAYTWLSWRVHRERPNDTTIPTWKQLGQGVMTAVKLNPRTDERWMWEDGKASGLRFFAGLGLGIAVSLALGMLMGCWTPVEAFFQPPMSLLAKIPPTAALAVFFALVGTDTEMYVSMIAFGVIPTLTIAVYLAVSEFPEELQFKAYTLGASHMEVIWVVIFRYVLPRLIDAIRLVIGPAMVFLIAAEMLVGDVGFGYRIRLQSKLLNMNLVYPYLALLAAFGFGMDFALKLLQRKLCPWYEGARE